MKQQNEPEDVQGLIEQLAASPAPFGDDQPSGFERMTEHRFYAFGLWGLPSAFRQAVSPVSFWSADAERLLSVVYEDPESSKFGIGMLARDSQQRYRMFAHLEPFPTVRAAEAAIRGKWGRSALEVVPQFGVLDEPAGVDLFATNEDIKQFHPGFEILRDSVNQTGAKALLRELSHWISDFDGNLVRDFQTEGYSARVWEIYLLFAFREMNFRLMHEHQSPDFHLERNDREVFVEATTVNAADRMSVAGGFDPPPPPPKNFWEFIEKEMPLKFGSPLHSKMNKRYWDLDHVKGRPLVLAIADFHDRASMVWSHTALPIYLNGVSAELGRGNNGEIVGKEKKIAGFSKGETKITPFFQQPDTEHVSAVLFSNAGTIAKFNRMAVKAGFGDPFVSIRRIGGWHDPDPGAFEAIPFDLDVESPFYSENWAGELEMHHNPKALYPIEDELFPGIAHFRTENGEAGWRGGPAPRVLFSRTMTIDRLGRKPVRNSEAEPQES